MSLSTSTTSTTAYTLTKYSRAYTSPSRVQEADAEWQHFTNPTMRLVLDMRKSSSGELESYRCRVLWSLTSGDDAMDVDQNEVTFEDLELLSFSSPSMLQSQKQMFAVHGLPLKAVYRDSVVGIRYQHPYTVPAGTTPTYRRFQMNFKSISDASSFVDAIRPVCPCKANPPAVPSGLQNRSMTMAPKSSESLSATSLSVHPPAAPISRQALRPAMTMQPSRPPSFPGQRQIVTEDRASVSEKDPHPILPTSSSMHASSSDSIQAVHGLSRAITSIPTQKASAYPGAPGAAQMPSTAVSDLNAMPVDIETQGQIPHPAITALSGYVPGLAAPDLSGKGDLCPPVSDIPLPPLFNAEANIGQPPSPKDALLASLREVPPLYDLERTELENLVAEVIREDGFLKLLQTLDSMWKVKTCLGPIANASNPNAV